MMIAVRRWNSWCSSECVDMMLFIHMHFWYALWQFQKCQCFELWDILDMFLLSDVNFEIFSHRGIFVIAGTLELK